MNEPRDNHRRLTPNEKKALDLAREQRHQAQEAGCFTLIHGNAFSEKLRRDISADDATHHDGPFICRGCRSDAILRKCHEKKDHYAHYARTSPVIGPEETELHKNCLRELCDALTTRFPDGNWAMNRTISANPNKGIKEVVPDISGRLGGPKDQPLVIEAQVSCLSIPKIIERSEAYFKRNIPILWIVPLTEDLGYDPFRPRLYERYLHTMYFGRVYYWKPSFGTEVLPVHFGVADRRIPYNEWYDKENEEERTAGGYDKPYKVIKRPVMANQLDITLDFKKLQRGEFRPWNERKKVPPLCIWKDIHSEWWDTNEDEEFKRKFKEDNLPPEGRKKKNRF